jgi:hypothetical protein
MWLAVPCESLSAANTFFDLQKDSNKCKNHRVLPGLLRVVRFLTVRGLPPRYVDVGAYGNPKRWPKPPNPSPYRESTRSVEHFVREVGGYQMLYADS